LRLGVGNVTAMDLDESVAAWCATVLGAAPVREIFRRRHLSEVLGLELDDGRQVVVKVRPGSPRLDAATAVQRHVHRQGFPCPDVLAGPLPLGDRVATAEEYIAPHGPPPDPPPPAPVARLLAQLVAATPRAETATALSPPPPWVGWDHPGERLWPWPDDLDVDMDDHPGPDWVDDTAARIRERMQYDASPSVIGHIDWEANNLDWDGNVPVVVHDWDSLAIRTEAAIAGAAAAVFPANGVNVAAATIEQTAAFLHVYREVRSAQWTTDSDEIAWCAGLWVLTYNAKKESLGGGTGYIDQLSGELVRRRSYAAI
jgi:hypothetical protein